MHIIAFARPLDCEILPRHRGTVRGKLSANLQPGTLKSILRQAGLKD